MIYCYITDRGTLAPGESLLNAISRNLAAGPNWVQIREKDLPARELYELVRQVLQLPNPRRVEILVNTRLDVALAAGAAGAHLPAGSPPPQFWRRLSTDLAHNADRRRRVTGNCGPSASGAGRCALAPIGFRIGVSCHSVEEVRQAEHEGADYVFFGPVFDPISKQPELPARGLGALSRAAMSVQIPVVALGGITAENMRACISAGAAGVAGISLYQNAKATC